MSNAPIYLDHNATTPLAPGLSAVVADLVQHWGNPSSIHHHGRGPKTLLREARLAVASLIQADPLEIIFTSGGSEANNLAFQGLLPPLLTPSDRREILISDVEHPSVI